MLNIINLGAGVQSSTMALMAARGELGYDIDCAIFADTGAEPGPVYDHLAYLEGLLPFPVHRVDNGNLLTNIMATDVIDGDKERFVSVPFFTNFKGDVGMTRRQCTREFKIEPIHKKVRELLGLAPRQRGPKTIAARQFIGISMDEITRMKESGKAYIEHVFPLIEKRMSRWHCLEWLKANSYREPPKSACTFCPYHDDGMWRDMKANDPASFAQAVAVDQHIRGDNAAVKRGVNAELFLHRSMKPLAEVDFSSAEDNGQQVFGFGNECEGMCGV